MFIFKDYEGYGRLIIKTGIFPGTGKLSPDMDQKRRFHTKKPRVYEKRRKRCSHYFMGSSELLSVLIGCKKIICGIKVADQIRYRLIPIIRTFGKGFHDNGIKGG